MSPVASVDEYIDQAPEDTREMLTALRTTIRNAAPEAQEVISYGIPTYRLYGPLTAFGYAKEHCGFYVMTETAIAAFADELKPFSKAKTTVRFPLGTEIPSELVAKVVQKRIEENQATGRKK